MKLVQSYHECYHPDADLNDEYYRSRLEAGQSFDDAMELFRTYYQTIASCDPVNGKCDCFRAKMSSEPDYSLFFTNASSFNDVKRIAMGVKSGFRLR